MGEIMGGKKTLKVLCLKGFRKIHGRDYEITITPKMKALFMWFYEENRHYREYKVEIL